MSLYCKIRCGNCKNSFDVYQGELNYRNTPVRCPHCLQKMSDEMWKSLVESYLTVQDLNYQALKAHEEHQDPLFSVEMRYKQVDRNKMILK